MLREIEEVDVHLVWPEAEVYLRQAIDTEDLDNYVTRLKARIFGKLSQLWQVKDPETGELGYAVSSLYTNEGLIITAQIYIATADDLTKLIAHMDTFTVWAMRKGAHYVEIVGRKGWEKVLREHGFKHNYTSLIKRIDQELH